MKRRSCLSNDPKIVSTNFEFVQLTLKTTVLFHLTLNLLLLYKFQRGEGIKTGVSNTLAEFGEKISKR